jgi:hypothetical protein
MTPVTFTYKGKSYNGFMEASREDYPYFYWCFLNDSALIEEFGDCITFKKTEDGILRPTQYYAPEYREFLEHLKGVLEQFIKNHRPA